MIHQVWIINRAGICLLDRNYSGLEINKQLFSGFITAISSLASQFNRTLDSISMSDMTIHYTMENEAVIAVAVDRDDNEEEIRRKLHDLLSEFNSKFGEMLVDWDGNLSYFDSFTKDLDRILMLDWNFEYDLEIKTKNLKKSGPRKTPLNLTQRGQDLFEAVQVNSKSKIKN
ncbi:MAG: hypothetical protein LUQ65_12230 [Candidatus Helarchaeota archaeon]|nr:hypothetical protein [Candidatus Helarchaeota archaeon]